MNSVWNQQNCCVGTDARSIGSQLLRCRSFAFAPPWGVLPENPQWDTQDFTGLGVNVSFVALGAYGIAAPSRGHARLFNGRLGTIPDSLDRLLGGLRCFRVTVGDRQVRIIQKGLRSED